MKPRWRKMLRDVLSDRGRALLLVAAIATGTVAVGAVLGAYGILSREMSGAYLGTRPASMSIELEESVAPGLVDDARRWRGVEDAEARGTVVARARVGEDWRPLVIFVIDDFDDLRMNRFESESGPWPPPEGTLLLERAAVPMLEVGLDDALVVEVPGHPDLSLAVAGVVHDPGLAPAWQERGGYAYLTRETAAALGLRDAVDELRILAADGVDPEALARESATRLRTAGYSVHEVRVPPPGQHPHQSQTTSVLLLLVGCALMTALLSALLVAAVLSVWMARQARELAIMKAIGATPRELARMYVGMLLGLGAVATLASIIPAMGMSHVMAGNVARLLNFDLASMAIPWWTFAAEAIVGIVFPVLASLGPIVRASRRTVRDALDDHGAPPDSTRFTPALARLATPLRMIVRNLARQPRRVLMTTALLSIGGAMFVSSMDVANAWTAQIDEVYRTRFYDVEVRLAEPVGDERLLTALRSTAGVTRVEGWGYAPASIAGESDVEITHTYPDQRHGSFALLAPPRDAELVRFPVIAGRWVREDDTDGIVLNHMAIGTPQARVGDALTTVIDGHRRTWRVVGIVREVGSPAAGYVSRNALASATGGAGIRIVRIAGDGEAVAMIRAVEATLAELGVPVETATPLAELRTAVGDHMAVLIGLLMAMALLLAAVGALGLASAMGLVVSERRRELGVLRVLGASPRAILELIVGEGVLTALLSFPLAITVALGASAVIGGVVGSMTFRVPLPIVLSPSAALGWLALTVLVGAGASLAPAWRASKTSLKDALG